MKTFSLAFATACLLLTGCGGDTSSDATTLDSNQIRQPTTEAQVAPPGDGIKLGSNNSGGPGAAKPKPEGK